jgi:hypothetical protein
VCQRVVQESTRWVYWHPKDNALDGLLTPVPGPRLRIETVGWRDREDGTWGELVRTGMNRPIISNERLLSGKPIVDRHGELIPPWRSGTPGIGTNGQ